MVQPQFRMQGGVALAEALMKSLCQLFLVPSGPVGIAAQGRVGRGVGAALGEGTCPLQGSALPLEYFWLGELLPGSCLPAPSYPHPSGGRRYVRVCVCVCACACVCACVCVFSVAPCSRLGKCASLEDLHLCLCVHVMGIRCLSGSGQEMSGRCSPGCVSWARCLPRAPWSLHPCSKDLHPGRPLHQCAAGREKGASPEGQGW